jgi:alpha-N-arabinofuranosidase
VNDLTGYEVTLGEPTARVPRQLFGANLESALRILYGGVWDQRANQANASVKAAVAGLGLTALRFPGSSSACDYEWRDGIGPREQRPTHNHTWWTDFGRLLCEVNGITGDEQEKLVPQIGPPETNAFGTDEFLHYCLDVGADPMLNINVGGGDPAGTGTPEEAAAWVRYCNVEGRAPCRVDRWQIGNEIWGRYELGHRPPAQYAERVRELATAMRAEDPSILLYAVAAGLEEGDFGEGLSATMPHLPEWNRTVFSEVADVVDGATFTWYFPGLLGRALRDDAADTLQIMSGGDLLGAALDSVTGELDSVGGDAARLPVYVTEWGMQVCFPEDYFAANHRLCDGLFFAGCLNRLVERSGRVAGANLSMLVNAVSPVQVVGERIFVTAAYRVVQLYSRAIRSLLVPVDVQTDRVVVPAMADIERASFAVGVHEDRQAATLDASATADGTGATVFLTNRDLEGPIEVTVRGLTQEGSALLTTVEADSPWAKNTVEDPDAIRLHRKNYEVRDGVCHLKLPPCTAAALEVGPREGALIGN